MQYLDAISKVMMIFVRVQGKTFSITVIQVYVPTSNDEEAEQFYEDLQDLLELKPKKRCSFYYRGLECKVGSQEPLGVTGKFGLGVLPREHSGHSKYPLPITQENTLHMDTTRWSTAKSD